MKALTFVLVAVLFLFCSTVSADTIYQWTDEKGVKRFGDSPPPGAVNVVEMASEKSTPSSQNGGGTQRRESFDQMIDQAKQESEQHNREAKAKQAASDAAAEQEARDKANAPINKEIQALEKEIMEIRNRALSPTLTEGMKEAQIAKIQKQIDQLREQKK